MNSGLRLTSLDLLRRLCFKLQKGSQQYRDLSVNRDLGYNGAIMYFLHIATKGCPLSSPNTTVNNLYNSDNNVR